MRRRRAARQKGGAGRSHPSRIGLPGRSRSGPWTIVEGAVRAGSPKAESGSMPPRHRQRDPSHGMRCLYRPAVHGFQRPDCTSLLILAGAQWKTRSPSGNAAGFPGWHCPRCMKTRTISLSPRRARSRARPIRSWPVRARFRRGVLAIQFGENGQDDPPLFGKGRQGDFPDFHRFGAVIFTDQKVAATNGFLQGGGAGGGASPGLGDAHRRGCAPARGCPLNPLRQLRQGLHPDRRSGAAAPSRGRRGGA